MKTLNTLFVSVLLFCSMSIGAERLFSKEETVFPLEKNEIERFLNYLNDVENQKVVGMDKGPYSFKELPKPNATQFSKGSTNYMLYSEDFNNDGAKEYLVVYINGDGSGSGVQGVYSATTKKLTAISFPAKNSHKYVGRPFAIRQSGKIVMRFLDDPKHPTITAYRWTKDKIEKVK